MEQKVKSENGRTEGRIKDFISENSEENFELSEVGSELVRTGCSNQEEAMRNFQKVVEMLQLSGEPAEHLRLSMLGEVNREEQVGFNYRCDQRTGQEPIVIPSEGLEPKNASTEFEKELIEGFDEKVCEGKENIYKKSNNAKSLM